MNVHVDIWWIEYFPGCGNNNCKGSEHNLGSSLETHVSEYKERQAGEPKIPWGLAGHRETLNFLMSIGGNPERY